MNDENEATLNTSANVQSDLPEKPSETIIPRFKADKKDALFALAAFILGYFFCRWVLVSVQGWGIAVFTTVYLAAGLFYLIKKGVRINAESWFWFAVTFLTGLSFALWNGIGLMPLRNMFLFCSAIYWVLSATSALISGRTGNYLILDGLNGVLLIPFRNFANQYRSLAVFKGSSQKGGKKLFSVISGIVLAFIVVLIVIPQLIAADSGGFSNLIKGLLNLVSFDASMLMTFLFYCLLAIPTAAYLFGLISGSTARRGTDAFTADKTEKTVSALRILAPATIFIILGTVCVLYTVFIVCQLPYFFSAFSGARPAGWLSYSDYARRGFFELCQLASINLLLLTVANVMSKKPRTKSTALKIFNIALSLVTLILIATALSKMALYISAFGLTVPRILPCVFMVFLTVVCVSVIAMQKLRFSVARTALIAGAVLFTVLCLFDADGFVARYNTDRYLSGTLTSCDTEVFARSGIAGVPYAVEIYNKTSDVELKNNLREYLKEQKGRIAFYKDTFRDTLQTEQAWERIKSLDLG